MGSFEKLGILVIVVIIVMILAVAIYQWGGTEGPAELRGVLDGETPKLSVVGPHSSPAREIDFLDREEHRSAEESEPSDPNRESWPGGIPKTYIIKSGDNVWNLVVKDWGLKEGFTGAITRANPERNMKLLQPGHTLQIPNPDAYRFNRGNSAPRKSAPRGSGNGAVPVGINPSELARGARIIEVQEGDMLGTIAYEQLGRASRMKEIIELNPGIDPEKLKPGQRLVIPAK